MNPTRKVLLEQLSHAASSPVLRQIQQMAKAREAEIDTSAPVQTVHELLSIWSIRLWNATLNGRRFVGLADLVRHLMTLPSDGKVRQVSLRSGSRLGLIFFCQGEEQPVGAVVSVRSNLDTQKSRSNFDKAASLQFPAVRSAVLAASRG